MELDCGEKRITAFVDFPKGLETDASLAAMAACGKPRDLDLNREAPRTEEYVHRPLDLCPFSHSRVQSSCKIQDVTSVAHCELFQSVIRCLMREERWHGLCGLRTRQRWLAAAWRKRNNAI